MCLSVFAQDDAAKVECVQSTAPSWPIDFGLFPRRVQRPRVPL